MSKNTENFGFDEKNYLRILKKAISRYNILDITLCKFVAGEGIWRHDVDVSPHRAKKIAILEKSMGVRAHYYFMFESRFYNLFEPQVVTLVREIADLGHHIGLHFDVSNIQYLNKNSLESAICLKQDIFKDLFGIEIQSLSIHDPTKIDEVFRTAQILGGLVNASADLYMNNFTYCSDSNGYWRHRALDEVIDDPTTQSLYSLTHPEWWAPVDLRPSERIKRSIYGRAESVLLEFELDLKKQNRHFF